jgi:CBS-domain-containing membrane protein
MKSNSSHSDNVINSDLKIGIHDRSMRHKKLLHYFAKMKGDINCPPRPPLRHIIWSWLGGCLGIGAVAYLSLSVNTPLLMAPFGATCVLAFGVSDSPLAQPRNIVGGHLLSTLIGLICLQIFGQSWWAMAIAVASAIAGMQLTRTVHPPAGADPLVVILIGASWNFLLTPVLLGSIILVICALIFNNLIKERTYPKYWF